MVDGRRVGRMSSCSSPYSIICSVFVEEVNKSGKNYLTRGEVEECLLNTPGMVFPAGTTMDDIFKKLDNWGFVVSCEKDGESIYVPIWRCG